MPEKSTTNPTSTQAQNPYRSGFAALLGLTNAGKSCLLNKLLGQKVSIVTPKPQTTRDNIRGILSAPSYQIVFIDTPGLHKPQTALGNFMTKSAERSAKDADVLVYVIDANKGVTPADARALSANKKSKAPLIIAVNKIDEAAYEKTYPLIEGLKEAGFNEILPLSALTGENTEKLPEMIAAHLPEGEPLYPTDEVTDRPLRFLAAEIIREKALLFLQQEVPHGVGVEIASFDESGKTVKIDADLLIDKAAHKSIVIGKDGAMLKRIGTSARLALEKLLENKVMLKIFVRVEENWRNSPTRLSDLGYKNK